MASGVKSVRGGPPTRTDSAAVAGRGGPREVAASLSANSPSDRVSLSGAGSYLQGIVRSLESVPVVDLARVSSVRDALVSGGYEVNPYRIADKLIRFELMLPETGYGDPGIA